MAKAVGISHTSVQRIWREAGLKPHLTRSFKISNDPMFEEKVTDTIGLYMSPPDCHLGDNRGRSRNHGECDAGRIGLAMRAGRHVLAQFSGNRATLVAKGPLGRCCRILEAISDADRLLA